MQATTTMQEAAKLLNYKSTKSLRAWCRKAGVKIYSDKGGRKFLILSLLMDEHLKEFKQDLQKTFGPDWVEAYKTYMTGDIPDALSFGNPNHTNIDKENTYQPTGKHEKNFLAKLLTKSSPELR